MRVSLNFTNLLAPILACAVSLVAAAQVDSKKIKTSHSDTFVYDNDVETYLIGNVRDHFYVKNGKELMCFDKELKLVKKSDTDGFIMLRNELELFSWNAQSKPQRTFARQLLDQETLLPGNGKNLITGGSNTVRVVFSPDKSKTLLVQFSVETAVAVFDENMNMMWSADLPHTTTRMRKLLVDYAI